MHPQAQRFVRLGVYLCLCLAPAVLYLSGRIHPFFVGNADMLAVPAFVDTVQAEGLSAFGDWYWPPAPYFLLDFVLYVPIWLALPDPWLAPAVFMLLQLGALALAGRLLARALTAGETSGTGAEAQGRAQWGAVASFALIVVLAERGIEPMRFVLASYYRAGTLIVTIVALALFLQMARSGEPWRDPLRLVSVMLALAILVASDPLAAPATTVPLTLLVVGLTTFRSERGGWGEHRRAGLVLAGCMAAGTVLGLVVNGMIVSDETSYGPSLSADAPRRQLARLADLLVALDWEVGLVGLASLTVLVAAGWAVGRRQGAIGAPTLVLGFWLVSTAGHLGAISIDTSEPTLRYLQVVFALPVLVAGPTMAVKAASVPRAARPAGPLAVAALVLTATVPAAVHIGRVDLETQPVEAECLDLALPSPERRTGVSGYWEARILQLHSDHERELATLDGLGSPYRINAAEPWFERPWSFAVIGSGGTGFDPPIDWIRKLGPTAVESTCGNYTVFVFDPPLDPTPFDQPGDRIRWTGCELDTVTGSSDPDTCILAVPAPGEVTFGSFGGHTPLPVGRYELALRYRSPAPLAVDVANLELTRHSTIGEDLEVAMSKPLSGTGGAWVTVNETLTVLGDGRNYVAELRTLAYGTHAYEVDFVEFTTLPAPR